MVTARWLPGLVVGAGLAAAWGAARYAGTVTALLVVALLTTLALPPAQRRLVSPRWAGLGLAVLAVGWAVALDHELALRHTVLFVLAAALFGLAKRAGADDRLVAVLAVGIAATAIMALLQAAGSTVAPLEALSELAPELRARAAQRLAIGRATGTASIPGHFAALLIVVAPLLVAGLARAASWRRLVWAAALALVVTGVVLSRSLAAVLIAGMVGALGVALLRPRWKVLAVGAAAILAIGASTALLRTDLAGLEPLRLRWVNWQTAAWVFSERPWLGAGLGGVGQAGLTAPTGAANITPYTHNTYLQLAAELGVPGMALVVAGVVALWRLVAAGRRDHLPLALAVAALPLHNLVDFSAYSPEVVLPWAVLAGTLAARVRPATTVPLSSWLLVPVLGGGLVLAAAAWRSEVLLTSAYAAPSAGAIELAMAAGRWAPWTVTATQAAAGAALGASDPRLSEIERELARRWWVRPVSAAWAETRARVLLALRRNGAALVWAREARRRAPWRGELAELEERCRDAS